MSFDCASSHLELFRRSGANLRELVLALDVLYVGGGNTANMLAIWRLHGLDEILRSAYEAGVVLAGVSAGAVCWFEGGTTDSFGLALSALRNGLGFLEGSMCPHYDGEENRRPRFHELIGSGALAGGYAADDGVALHFVDETFHRAVSSKETSAAYRVTRHGAGAVETVLATEFLGSDTTPPPPLPPPPPPRRA